MIAAGTKLLEHWRRLSPLPGGPWLFSRLFGFAVPYSGSVGPRIRVLEAGHAVVEIPGRRSNRNHLGSVHAIALMNLAEITSGLAMTAGLPPTVRGIVTTLSMTYHKKARGTIRAVAHVAVPTVSEDRDFDVMAECFDGDGTLVVHGHEFRAGLAYIRSLTGKPIGFNALIEASNKAYLDRMRRWIDVALEEGVRFFITSLGNPKWVCARVHALKGVVYHDVTERKWAQKGIESGVDGLIAVNSRAGGHAGPRSPEALFDELAPFGKPIVSAGGVGTPAEFARHLRLGYAAVQLGTRFIATPECKASDAYKQAIVDAGEDD
jgi:NAD(P)H-dependent flavin oxidoreductase YrpB (nitropropane dioxygenase family)